MKREIVEVEWFDAQHSTDAWTEEEIKEKLEPLHTHSVGYLIHDHKDYVILAFTDFGNGLIKHHLLIPRGMIIEINTIRKAGKLK